MNTYVGYSANPDLDIQITNGYFAWNESSAFLHNLELSVKAGSFHVIAGPTASGKTSLLASILGQMNYKVGIKILLSFFQTLFSFIKDVLF